MKVLKKYKNRKIYNPYTSKYVTLDEVFKLLKDEEIRIRDYNDNEITLQIVYEAISAANPPLTEAVKVLSRWLPKEEVMPC